MRILLVHDYAPPLGGAEVMNATMVHGLRRRGHEVRRFCSTAAMVDLPAGESPPEYECRGTTSRWRTLLQTANPWAATALQRAIDEFRPEVVHVRIFLTQLSPLILPVLRNVPVIYHAVWYRAVCPTGHKLLPDGRRCTSHAGMVCLREGCLPSHDWVALMAQHAMLQRWRHHIDLTVANSQWTAALLEDGGFPPVTVVPNGVPIAPQRAALDGEPAVVYVGRLSREKGVDTLLQAFAAVRAQLPTTTLTIVGDGPSRTELEGLCRTLALDGAVRFTGHLPRAEAETIAASAWVQVVPSRWAEPFGIVAAEAMMRGTAVVATDSGGLAELVQPGETGVRVPPGRDDLLAEALVRVLADRTNAERLGANGRTVALAQLTDDIFVDRMLDCYAQAQAIHAAGRVA